MPRRRRRRGPRRRGPWRRRRRARSEQALPGRRVRSRRALSPRSGSAPVRLELAPPQFFVGVRHIGRGRSTRGRGRRPECGARRSLVRGRLGRLGRRRGGIIRSDPRPGITDLSTGRPHTKVMLHLSIQKSIPLAPFRNGSYRVSHISFSSAYFMFSYRSGENPVRPRRRVMPPLAGVSGAAFQSGF